jgi:hypothetical protein
MAAEVLSSSIKGAKQQTKFEHNTLYFEATTA